MFKGQINTFNAVDLNCFKKIQVHLVYKSVLILRIKQFCLERLGIRAKFKLYFHSRDVILSVRETVYNNN